jgi:hypothetical protein
MHVQAVFGIVVTVGAIVFGDAPALAQAPANPEAAAPDAAPTASETTRSTPMIEQRIAGWIDAAEAPTPELIASALGGLSTTDFQAYRESLEAAIRRETALTRLDRAKLVLGNFYLALQKLEPVAYPPESTAFRSSTCWNRPHSTPCDSRFGGFSAAARNRVDGKECWESLETLGRTKGVQFRVGYVDWWKKHVEPNESCEKPPTPARCLVAWCPSYKYGLGFRPSIQLGGTFGDGLGFTKEDAKFAGQLSASLGIRFFFFSDALDVHGGFGIGTSTASVATADGGSEDRTAAFLLSQLGIGAFNGMFGLAWLHSFDPRSGGGSGNGISVFVDAVAVERLVAQ